MSKYKTKIIYGPNSAKMSDIQTGSFRFLNNKLFSIAKEKRICYVYKIMRIEYLLNLLQKKPHPLFLLNVGKWEDPYELLYFKQPEHMITEEMKCCRDQLFGQSWSFRSESDALWRIYSPDKQSVRICSSVQRLYNLLYQARQSNPNLDYYLGAVDYQSRKDLHQWLAKKNIKEERLKIIQSLFYKRINFQHENEFRIIVQDTSICAPQNGITIPLDDISFIYSVEFDPRIDDFYYEAWRECLMNYLPKAKIKKSKLYEISGPKSANSSL